MTYHVHKFASHVHKHVTRLGKNETANQLAWATARRSLVSLNLLGSDSPLDLVILTEKILYDLNYGHLYTLDNNRR